MIRGALCAGMMLVGLAAQAQPGDRLLATGGATQIEGAAGGGIVPWAVLAGYGERGQHGGTFFHTVVDSGDYRLRSLGAAWSWNNRVEFSVASQRFDLGALRRELGLPWEALRQDVFGMKVRLFGDLVYGAAPQLSVGLQHKRVGDFALPQLVGAADDSGTDVYIVASKLFLAGAAGRNLLLSAGLRGTDANQTGLLGFGAGGDTSREWVFEGSAAILLDSHWAIGLEYREKPDRLAFAREDDWRDLFVAWFPDKRWSVVAAWADLGDIAGRPDQRAPYLSVQWSW